MARIRSITSINKEITKVEDELTKVRIKQGELEAQLLELLYIPFSEVHLHGLCGPQSRR